MSTPQQILESVKTKRLHLARLWVAVHKANDELLSEEQRYLDALHAQHLAAQGAAAIEAVNAILAEAGE